MFSANEMFSLAPKTRHIQAAVNALPRHAVWSATSLVNPIL